MIIGPLSDRPLLGEHVPLLRGWSDDQCRRYVSAVYRIMPLDMAFTMTDAMATAMIAIARSLHVADRRHGRPSHYSRRYENYLALGSRYHDGDPRNTYQFTVKAMDNLERLRLVKQTIGELAWHRQSISELTDAGRRFCTDTFGPDDESPDLDPHVETIILRHRGDSGKHPKKALKPYVDTDETNRMRAEMAVINEAMAATVVFRDGERTEIPIICRIFNGGFDLGGRLYCQGNSFQNMRSFDRRGLQIGIDADPHPVVEIDFCELHPRMAYAEAGAEPPDGDLYKIPGFRRSAVKLAFNTRLNAPTPKKAFGAVAHELGAQAGRLIKAVDAKHHAIQSLFGSDSGARFQRKDSDMIVEIMLEMIALTGRCPLPMHDSLLVADVDEDDLFRVMKKVAHSHNLPLKLATTRRAVLHTSPSHPPTHHPHSPLCTSYVYMGITIYKRARKRPEPRDKRESADAVRTTSDLKDRNRAPPTPSPPASSRNRQDLIGESWRDHATFRGTLPSPGPR